MENCCGGSGSTMTTPAMMSRMANGGWGSEAKAEAGPETSAQSQGRCNCGPTGGSDALPAAEATAKKTSCC